MEFAGRPRPSEACNYLAVPGLSGLYPDEDEDDLVVGFRPKSSPIPSRRSSFSDEDLDPEPPYCSSRRVSFADAKGLSLVQVKEFATWDVPKLPGSDFIAVEGKDSVEYHLSPLTFSLALPSEEVLAKVLSQKVELETIGLLPGTTILKGVVRVLNISYNKSVYIRTSLDRWATHFDLLAEYVPGSSDGVTDSFSFKLTLGPPFGDQGVRVDFCLRYETPVGTFWANNNSRNYVLSCQRGMKGGTEKPQRENANKKSCLKITSQSVSTVENISSKPASSQENMSTDESVWGPEVGTLKTKKTSERQSTASTREGQKLLMENKQNSSRRRQRQAARMARLRDFYTQRDGGANDPGKDETPTETKHVTREEAPGDNVVSLQPFNEGQVKSDCPQFVFEALEEAHDQTSTKQVKSDLAVLARGESAPDVSNNPLDSDGEPAPEEQPNTSKFVTTNQDGDMSLPCTSNSATARSKTLISQSDSFTFCTVVAPLFCQTFQRVSAENPVNTGDFSLPSEPTQTCGVVPVSTRSNMGKYLTSTQGSSDESLSVKLVGPTFVEKKTLNKIPKHLDIVENPSEMEKKSNQSLGQQCPVVDNVPFESVNSQTEAQEDILAYGAPQCQSTEQNVSPGSAKVEETLSKDESKEDIKDFWIMLEHIDEGVDLLVNGVQEKVCESAEISKENESRKTALVKDKLLQIFDELNTNLTDSKVCLNSLVYLCEPERTNITSLAASSETQQDAKETEAEGNESTTGEIKEMYEVTQSIINDIRSNNECHADMTGRHKHQNVVEETGQCEMDPSFLKQDEDLLSIDIVEEKNWEKMVEEEENCVLSNEEERELLHLMTETSETEENVEEVKVQIAVELESQAWLGKEFQQAKARKTDGTESTEVDKIKGQEVAEQQIETERQWMSMEKATLREEEEKMETDMKQDIIIPVIEAEELVVTDADSDMTKQNEDERGSFKVGTDFTQNKVEDDLSTLGSRAAKNCPSERQYASIHRDTLQSNEEEDVHSKKDDQSNTHTKHLTSKGDMCDSAEEPDSASAESDSDEELRLYVRCLRGPQVHTDKIREAGFTARKRPSISRSKVPTTSMPSISEALDEEQQHSSPLETDEDVRTAAEARAYTQESIQQTERRWKDLFSCDKVSKTLLYASLMVVFTVVAYHYDFLACFLLYLISVIWLCCQRERDPIKNK